MNTEYANLGPLAIIFGLAVKEFFSWMKSRDKARDDSPSSGYQLEILGQMEKIANNDLVHILSAIEAGTKRLVDIIHEDNIRIIEILGKIEGKQK